jgi:hypothetical protein
VSYLKLIVIKLAISKKYVCYSFFMFDGIHTLVIAFHVLGACIIIGGLFASLLLLTKPKISAEILEHLALLGWFVSISIGFQIISGLYLAATEWDKFGHSPLLISKVVLLILDGLFGGKVMFDRIKSGDLSRRHLIWFSLILFCLIATLGVFLAESE